MPSTVNQAIFKLVKRAEKYDKEHLLNTFVDVGPLLTLLKNPDHQILYGRRGTGKTHALSYLQGELEKRGSIAVYIDMRNIGSNGGIYSDLSLPITERATRLLIDTFSIIHDKMLEHVLENDTRYDLSVFGPLLDEVKSAISEIEVVGNVETEKTITKTTSDTSGLTLEFAKAPKALVNFSNKVDDSNVIRKKQSGATRHRVHFTTINGIFARLLNQFKGADLWILIDEWAEVPLDLQPYLSDLFRRTLFPLKGVTIKIAAIEKRTNFKLDSPTGYIGIESGADISASISLDEFMVFDNDPQKSMHFFSTLFYNHVKQFLPEGDLAAKKLESFISQAFTQKGAFEELVRASEGIPRDAINILINSAIKADNNKISIPIIQSAARKWYNNDKEVSVNAKTEAKLLLRWIIDEVIGQRKSRAFLLSSDIEDDNIEYLFDNRIIHLIKQNISSKDAPGERYNVYSIDYGAYVHLINTNEKPIGLFLADTDGQEGYVDVPVNDYRSIRRSILDLRIYYAADN